MEETFYGVDFESVSSKTFGNEKRLYGEYGKETKICAYCLKKEVTTGVSISYSFDPITKKFTFSSFGKNLCSFSCRLSYCHENKHLPGWERVEEITRIEFNLRFPGKVLSAAPPRPYLEAFGGSVKTISDEIEVTSPPNLVLSNVTSEFEIHKK